MTGLVLLCCLQGSICQRMFRRLDELHVLEPGYDVDEVEHKPCSVRIARTDWVSKRLERQCAAVKGGDRPRRGSLALSG